jgi:hypothetical protein
MYCYSSYTHTLLPEEHSQYAIWIYSLLLHMSRNVTLIYEFALRFHKYYSLQSIHSMHWYSTWYPKGKNVDEDLGAITWIIPTGLVSFTVETNKKLHWPQGSQHSINASLTPYANCRDSWGLHLKCPMQLCFSLRHQELFLADFLGQLVTANNFQHTLWPLDASWCHLE